MRMLKHLAILLSNFQEDSIFVSVFLLTFFQKKVRPRWPSDESNSKIKL